MVKTARRTAARRTATRRSPARRTAARRSPARRSAARRSAARKSTARKSTARRSPVRKSASRRSTARKSTARKPVARKSKEDSDVESFLRGISTDDSVGTYEGLGDMFQEDEKGYKSAKAPKKLDQYKVKRTTKVVREKAPAKKSKKGASPYNLYVKKMSPILKKENPNMKQSEIMKLIGAEWKKEKA